MRFRVIQPPGAIVSPTDLVGGHAADDASALRVIAAVQRSIEGPSGWLGRALMPQTLEASLDSWGCAKFLRLPFPPLIEVETVKYLDPDEVEQTVASSSYREVDDGLLFAAGFNFPATTSAPDAVRIRYRAGYDGEDVADGGTGAVPAEAKQAVILAAQQMLALGSIEDVFLKVDQVEGIGRREFALSDQASRVVERACESLLWNLRIHA